MLIFRAILRITVLALCVSLSSCSRKSDEPPVTLEIAISERHFPQISYSAGPVRTYQYSSNLYNYEARIGSAGRNPSVSLKGNLTWQENRKKRAIISFHLENTEPVVVELAGMHLTNPDATEEEAVIRERFPAGRHDFKQEVFVVFVLQ